MQFRAFIRVSSVVLALVLGLWAAPGPAQYVPPTDIPDIQASRDQFGVNLVTRKIDVEVYGGISIGPNGPGGLSYIWSNSNNAATDTQASFSTSGGTYTVARGAATRTFALSGGLYTNNQGTGETLTYDAANDRYTYTTRDGAVLLFGKLSGSSSYRPLSLTYPAGEVLTWNYDAARIQRSVTTSLGFQMRPIFSAQGYWTKLILFNMADETCDPIAVTCALTGSWPTIDFAAGTINGEPANAWTTNSTTNTVTHTFPTGRTVVYTRDADNRVTSVSDGNGTWTYSWPNPYGGVTLITPPDRTSPRQVSWNTTTGLILFNTDHSSDGSGDDSYGYTYDNLQRITSVTHNGIATNYTYDARGNVTETRKISRTPGTPADIVTTAVFPVGCTIVKTCNKPTSMTDARGKVTDYTYDAASGGLASLAQPPAKNGIRAQITYTYTAVQAKFRNGSGVIIQGAPAYRLSSTSQCATQAAGTCAGAADEVTSNTSYGPDDAISPIAVSAGSGDGLLTATTTYTYTPTGDVKTVAGPISGQVTRYYYDASRRPLGKIGPDPDGAGILKSRAVRVSYNPDGQPIETDIGTAAGQGDSDLANMSVMQNALTTYNAQGRKSKDTLNSGTTTYLFKQYSYTPSGYLDCVAVRMDPSTYAAPPASACAQTTGNPDRITQYLRNGLYLIKQVVVGVGTTSAATQQSVSYTNLMPATMTDGENNATSYKYDGFDRLIEMDYPNVTKGSGTSNPADNEQFAYDPAGNITSHTLRGGTAIAFTYDDLNRKTLKDLPGTEYDVIYAYDNLGRMTDAWQKNGSITVQHLLFGWDALSRNISQGGPHGTLDLTYDLAGRKTKVDYPGTGLYFAYDYLTTGEVTRIRENGVTTGVGVLATYTYDDLGNRLSLLFGNGVVQNFTYDPIARLKSFTNDLAGASNDLTIDNVVYNQANQVTSLRRVGDSYSFTGFGGGTTNYTANGLNQQVSIGGATATWDAKGNLTNEPQSGKTYGYSSENLLVSTNGGAGSASLTYDPIMRLYQVAGGATTSFAYDGSNAIQEHDANNVVLRRFVFDPNGEPIVQYEGAGTTNRRFLSADDRGSIISATDSSGALIGINTYDEYGRPGATNLPGFGYVGKLWVPELNLYYFDERMYAPHLGLFVQADPIGTDGGINLYAYSSDDPINLSDPSGLQASCAGQGCPPVSSGPPVIVTGSLPPCGSISSSTSINCSSSDGGGFAGADIIDARLPQPGMGVHIPIPIFNYEARAREQAAACKTEPFASALANPDVQARINEAMADALRTPNAGLNEDTERDIPAYGSEYGFNYLRGSWTTHVSGVRTDYLERTVAIHPPALNLWGTYIFFHVHQSPRSQIGLSGRDLDSGYNIVAVRPDGKKFCAKAH